MNSAALILFALLLGMRMEDALEILRIEGVVSISSDGGMTWKELTKESSVYTGDQLRTGAGAYVDLCHEGGWRSRVLAESLVEIEASGERNDKVVPKVELQRGAYLAVADSTAGGMEITFPGGVCGAREPSAFRISAEAVTDCVEGRVMMVYLTCLWPPLVAAAGERVPKGKIWPPVAKDMEKIPEAELMILKRQVQELKAMGKRGGN